MSPLLSQAAAASSGEMLKALFIATIPSRPRARSRGSPTMMTMTTSFKDTGSEILRRISPPRLIGRGPMLARARAQDVGGTVPVSSIWPLTS